MTWTPLEELQATMVNVFAPRAHVFWFVRQYKEFQKGNDAYVDHLLRNPDTRDNLDGVIVESGGRQRSVFAYLLLGGLARRYGDRYYPDDASVLSLIGGRHISIIVPHSSRAYVSRYFSRQHDVFGALAVRACAEDRGMAFSSLPPRPPIFGLLQQPVDGMNRLERKAIVAQINALDGNYDSLRLDSDDNLPYSANAGAMLALLDGSPSDDDLADFTAILRFRAEVSVRHFALPVIERLKSELGEPGWSALGLADLREELRGMFDRMLSPFPIIQTNPFEAALRRETCRAT